MLFIAVQLDAFSQCCYGKRKSLLLSRIATVQKFKHRVCLSWTTKRKDTHRWKWLPECHAERWHSKGNSSTVLDGRQAQYFRASVTPPTFYKASLPKHYLILKQNKKITSDVSWTGKSLNPIHSFHNYEGPDQYRQKQISRLMLKACVNILIIQLLLKLSYLVFQA